MIPDKNPKANRFFQADPVDPDKQKEEILKPSRPILNKSETSQLLADYLIDKPRNNNLLLFLHVKAAGSDGITRPEIDVMTGIATGTTTQALNTLENAGFIVSFSKTTNPLTSHQVKVYHLPEFI